MKWKKHILDAIWHGDSFFESGTPVLKQTGMSDLNYLFKLRLPIKMGYIDCT